MTTHVLLVDDEATVAQTIADVLSLHDYHVTVASSGEEALALLAAHRPRLVLMDVQMPGMNGVETMEKMHEIMPGLPVILLTGYMRDSLARIARGGAAAVLNKPLDLTRLLDAVREWIA